MDHEFQWTRVTSSQLVYNGPCHFAGLILLGSAANKPVTVYDGTSSAVGRLFHTFTSRDAYSDDFLFPHPVRMAMGLYVTLDAAISECLVLWRPVPYHLESADWLTQAEAAAPAS